MSQIDRTVIGNAASNGMSADLAPSAQLIMGWRQKIVELLQTPVEAPPEPESGSQAQAAEPAESSNAALHGSTSTNPPPEGKPEEDVYAKSLQFQSDVQAYLVAYAAALMDRKGSFSQSRQIAPEYEMLIFWQK